MSKETGRSTGPRITAPIPHSLDEHILNLPITR
jgi:hypothetical protein